MFVKKKEIQTLTYIVPKPEEVQLIHDLISLVECTTHPFADEQWQNGTRHKNVENKPSTLKAIESSIKQERPDLSD